jgi:hypothetical protein
MRKESIYVNKRSIIIHVHSQLRTLYSAMKNNPLSTLRYIHLWLLPDYLPPSHARHQKEPCWSSYYPGSGSAVVDPSPTSWAHGQVDSELESLSLLTKFTCWWATSLSLTASDVEPPELLNLWSFYIKFQTCIQRFTSSSCESLA